MPTELPSPLPETGAFKSLYGWLNKLRDYLGSLAPANSFGSRTSHSAIGVNRVATPGASAGPANSQVWGPGRGAVYIPGNVGYLTGGEDVTIDEMNQLTLELDRRAGLALDNHSSLYLLGENGNQTREDFAPFLGPVFTFGNGPRVISGYWGSWSYDHSIFENAVASAVLLTSPNNGVSGPGPTGGGWPRANESLKYVRINPLPAALFTQIGKIKSAGNADWRFSTSLLAFSLEAHRKNYQKTDGTTEPFWVYETYSASSDTNGLNAFPSRLARVNVYHQAEIVFEGLAGIREFPLQWNRFRFFRFHNINATTLTIVFKGANNASAHTIEVAPYSSKCVRRDLVGGTYANPVWEYTDGGRYFQVFRAGDPRFYQHNLPNNVVNPAIYIQFVNYLLAGNRVRNDRVAGRIAAPTVQLDPHVRPPLPAGYASLYGNVESPGTKLFDCLTHFGELISARTDLSGTTAERLTFAGYESLALLPNVEFREVGNDLQVRGTGISGSVSRDFICLSTNLFCTGVNASRLSNPVVNLNDWFTLDRHMPPRNCSPVEINRTPQNVTYYGITPGGGLGAAVTKTIERATIQLRPHIGFFGNPAPPDLAPHQLKLEQVTADTFGNPVASGERVDAYTERMTLSSAGPALLTTQFISLEGPFAPHENGVGLSDDAYSELNLNQQLCGNVIQPLTNYFRYHATIEDGGLTLKRATVFTGYGWPDVDAWRYTGFLTPLTTRAYSDAPYGSGGVPVAGSHPDFQEGEANVNGEDVIYLGDRAGLIASEIAVLTTLGGANDFQYGGIGRQNNPDVLLGATKNVTTPGYWSANRTRCAQGQVNYNSAPDGSDFRQSLGFPDARGFYRFIRQEMAAPQFNNFAAKVNSIVKYRPLNWIDHGVVLIPAQPDFRSRLVPNSTSILDVVLAGSWYAGLTKASRDAYHLRIPQWAGLRPARQFCAFFAGDTIATTLAAMGIVPRGLNDLPDNFAQLRNTLGRLSKLRLLGGITFNDAINVGTGFFVDFGPRWFIQHNITNPVFTLDQIESEHQQLGFARPDLASVNTYAWVSIDDVKAHAESEGYKFLFASVGVGYDLRLFELEADLNSLGPITVSNPRDELRYWNFQVAPSVVSAPSPASYAIPQPVHVELDSGTFFTSRAVEFVPGENWIADGSSIQEQAMDWADVLPSINSGTFSYVVPRFVCAITDRTGFIPSVTPFQAVDCNGVLRSGSWIASQQASFSVSMAAQSLFLNADEPFRRVNYTNFFGLPATARNPFEYTPDLICREPLVIIEAPDDFQEQCRLLETDIAWLEFTPGFSTTSADAAKARASYGTNVLPFTVREGGAQRIQLWADFSRDVSLI